VATQTRWFSPGELAELIGCNRSWIQFLIDRDRLHGAIKTRGGWSIPEDFEVDWPEHGKGGPSKTRSRIEDLRKEGTLRYPDPWVLPGFR
jgi:hypothetical protein